MKLIKLLSLTFILAFPFTIANGQASYTEKDIDAYDAYMKWIAPHKGEATNQLLVRTAKYFMWAPYEANTLEKEGDEKLVINLTSFDCTTFVETTVALVQTIKSGDIHFENFCKKLQALRYRNGEVDGYSSRLHYMSDWIANNQHMGLLQDLSQKFGGNLVQKKINFMSTNVSKYPKLKESTDEVAKIRDIESVLSNSAGYYVLPAAQVRHNIKLIKDGDIVVFAHKKNNIDYAHMGIACWTIEGLTFIHASSAAKEIEQSGQSLYLYTYKQSSGLSIVRLTDYNK